MCILLGVGLGCLPLSHWIIYGFCIFFLHFICWSKLLFRYLCKDVGIGHTICSFCAWAICHGLLVGIYFNTRISCYHDMCFKRTRMFAIAKGFDECRWHHCLNERCPKYQLLFFDRRFLSETGFEVKSVYSFVSFAPFATYETNSRSWCSTFIKRIYQYL